jgi:hypothetical protein
MQTCSPPSHFHRLQLTRHPRPIIRSLCAPSRQSSAAPSQGILLKTTTHYDQHSSELPLHAAPLSTHLRADLTAACELCGHGSRVSLEECDWVSESPCFIGLVRETWRRHSEGVMGVYSVCPHSTGQIDGAEKRLSTASRQLHRPDNSETT